MPKTTFSSKVFVKNKPAFISILYLVLGLLWISLSDQLVSWMFSEDIRQFSRFQLVKGSFYVLLTSWLLDFFFGEGSL